MLLMEMAFGLDSPVPFVQKNAMQSTGLPGWYSSPARLGEPSFGFSYWKVPEVTDEWAMGAAGEWGNEGYRVSFFFYYSEMDSLFGESYGEWNAAYGLGPVVAGISYGTLLGWIPRETRWVRHRLKLGTAGRWGPLYGGFWTTGFTDESWSGWGSLSWMPSEMFSLSVGSNGRSLSLNHDFYFKYGRVSSFYRFPHFCVGVELVLNIKTLEWGATHGFGNGNLGWNGLWARKKLYLQRYDADF